MQNKLRCKNFDSLTGKWNIVDLKTDSGPPRVTFSGLDSKVTHIQLKESLHVQKKALTGKWNIVDLKLTVDHPGWHSLDSILIKAWKFELPSKKAWITSPQMGHKRWPQFMIFDPIFSDFWHQWHMQAQLLRSQCSNVEVHQSQVLVYIALQHQQILLLYNV